MLGTVVGCVVGGILGLALTSIAVYAFHLHNSNNPATIDPYPLLLEENPKTGANMVEVPVNRPRPVRPLVRSGARPATGDSSFIGGAPTVSMGDASTLVLSALESPRLASRPAEATALLQEILRRVQRLPVDAPESESEDPPPGYY